MKNALRIISLAAILMMMGQSTWAQKKLYLCNDYTATGEPIGVSFVWNIPKAGGAVYFVFKNDGKKFTTSRLYLFIDKRINNEYKQYDAQTMIANKYMDWALYDYTFTEAGSYKISVKDENGNELASEFCAIQVDGKSEDPNATTSTNADASINSDYYIGSQVQFCEDVDASGKPTRPSDVFNIGNAGGYLYVLVSHSKPLGTSQLIVDIWTGADYKEAVETINVNCDPNSKWVKFKYILKNDGNYKFSVFNKDQTFVENGYLTVNVR